MVKPSQNAEYYFHRSQENFSSGDIQGGWADLGQAIFFDPNNLEYRWDRGIAAYQAEKWELAVEDLSKIVEVSSVIEDLEEAFSKRAIAREYLGQYDGLIADIDWLTDHGFGTVNLYVWGGHHKYRLGQYENALKDFTAAHKMAPENNDVLLERAQVYFQMKRYEDAVEDLTQIINKHDLTLTLENENKYLGSIYQRPGRAYYELGNYSEALNDFNEEMQHRGEQTFSNVSDYIAKFGPL